MTNCTKITLVLIIAWIVLADGLADDPEYLGAISFVAPGQQVAGEIVLQSANSICVIAPGDLVDWVLDPWLGEYNNHTGILKVKSDIKWQVWVEDSEFEYGSEGPAPPKERGYMTEYNAQGDPDADPPVLPGYVSNPKRLLSTLKVSATTEGVFREVDLASGGLLATGKSTLNEPDGVKDVKVTLRQPTSWDDDTLVDEDHKYRMKITFTIIPDLI